MWETELAHNLYCGLSKDITFECGYNSGYLSNGGYTVLNGMLTIASGSISMENIMIR